jgi:hypothetical protein
MNVGVHWVLVVGLLGLAGCSGSPFTEGLFDGPEGGAGLGRDAGGEDAGVSPDGADGSVPPPPTDAGAPDARDVDVPDARDAGGAVCPATLEYYQKVQVELAGDVLIWCPCPAARCCYEAANICVPK